MIRLLLPSDNLCLKIRRVIIYEKYFLFKEKEREKELELDKWQKIEKKELEKKFEKKIKIFYG